MTAQGALRLGLAVVLLAGGAALADLPRLPRDLAVARGADSPGQVTFRHESHVDAARPACLPCHAERFGILGKGGEARRPAITHAAMEKGQACGACHGKGAFGFEDCSMCHAP
jgi:c(7)-type cytochrome triheme protein